MADHPSTIVRAQGMLEYLRTMPHGVAHEEARAAIAAATTYLQETFGDLHGFTTADGIVSAVATNSALMRCEVSPAGLH